jgi:hypothetical protein
VSAPTQDGVVHAVHVWRSGASAPDPVDPLLLDMGGPVGDRHYGLTMSSDVRQRWLYAEGTQIRNNRQVTIVDVDELAQIAANLGLDELAPGTVADNICTAGIADLTSLAPMTRLVFGKPDAGGPVVVVGGENTPCTLAGMLVEARYGTPPQKFPKAAIRLRGVSGWVERPGEIRPGDGVRVLAPRSIA